MKASKERKAIYIAAAIIGIFLPFFLGQKLLTKTNWEQLLFPREKNQLTTPFYPQLKLEFEHSQLKPTEGKTLQDSFEFLLDKLGYGVTWDKFHHTQYVPSERTAIRPETITIKVLPIEDYSQKKYGYLFNAALKEGTVASGYICQIAESQTDLICYFFLDDYFYNNPQHIEFAQLSFTNFLASNLLMMGNVEKDAESQQELFRQLKQDVDHLQFTQLKDTSLLIKWINQKIFAKKNWFATPVKATGECIGNLYCEIKQERCYCNDGTSCQRGEECFDETPAYECPVSSCETFCEGTKPFDPNENCWGLDNYPICYWDSYCSGAGICEGPALGSCSGGYVPPPDATATPVPPPPASCPSCCPTDMVCVSGRYADLDGDCAADEMCCTNCQYPDVSPQGQVRVWFFYDSNRNHQFDQEDQALPNEVVTNTRLRLHLTNKTCVDGQGQIIPCYEYIATGHTIPDGPGIAGELLDDQCGDSWSNFGECCPIDDPNCDSNEVCCILDPTFFKTCWGTCQDNNRAGSDGWTEDVNGVVDNIGDWWFKDTVFWGYYMGDDPSNEYLNYNNHKLATGTWGGYIADSGDGGGVNYAAVDLPEGYEVSVIRNQEPMDADQKITVEDQSYLNNRYINGVGGNAVTQELVVVGITPRNDPPLVLNSKVEMVGEQPFTSTYTASYCHSPSSQTEITLFSHYYDADEPASQMNLVDNPSFEQPLDGWTLHAADPDGTYNPAPHDAGVTDTVSSFGNQSAYIFKGAETSWGPQINYALPTLTIGQTYAFSVWAKTPQSAQFILQNTPVESCDGTGSDLDYSNYNSLKSESVSGSQDWQPLEFVYTPKNECETYTNIILSAAGSSINDTVYFDGVSVTQTISETEGELIYPFSDIKHFQINLENNAATEDVNGNLTGAYDSGQWPIRIFVNIAETFNQSPYYELRHGPNGDVKRTFIKYDFLENRWYLDQNLTIQNSSGVSVATLLSSNPDPINPDWQTYFEFVEGTDGKLDNIFAFWQLQLHEGFTADHYYVTSHVKDFLNQEDTRETYETEGYSRQRLYLTFGESSFAYWQRIGQLNAITPELTAYFYEDAEATPLDDNTCSGSTANQVTLTGNSVQVEDLDPAVSQISEATINNQNSVTLTPPSCTSSNNYNITLNLDSSTPLNQRYVCACRQDSDPYTCLYPDVDLNFLDENPQAINFFVQQADLSHGPWFQSVGGNILASGDILSYVPYNSTDNGPCVPTVSCEPALLTSLPWSIDNEDTPGFPLTAGSVDTIDGDAQYSNIHDGNRSQSDNGRAEGLTTQLPQRGYTYYYNKFGFDGETLSNNIMPTGLSTSDLNVYKYTGNLTISDTNSWNVPSNVKLVVFVDGDLTFSQNGTGSDAITSVEPGGFLAFIVSGDIIIDESVGHSMSSGVAESASNTPSAATSNLEGVFIAQDITVESNGTTEIDNKLIAEGTFVGWNSITLARNFANEGGVGATHNMYNPTETFIHRPDLVINMPIKMKEALHEWREVNPSKE